MRSIWNTDANPDVPVWRYFKPDRFIAAVSAKTLYFAAATQFTDPFEGAVQVLPPDAPPLKRESERAYFQKPFAELRRLTKISCWHKASHESDAMWRLYAQAHKGVALQTTTGRLHAALQPFRLRPEYAAEDPWFGDVSYVDLISERAPHEMLKRFFCKHLPYAWEQEYRLAISLRMAEDFGISVPNEGITVPIDTDVLMATIVLGPSLDPAERQLVLEAAEACGLSGRVFVSSLLGTPLYL